MSLPLCVTKNFTKDLEALSISPDPVKIGLCFTDVSKESFHDAMVDLNGFVNTVKITEIIFMGSVDILDLCCFADFCRTVVFDCANIRNLRTFKKFSGTYTLVLNYVTIVGHHLTKELSYLNNVKSLALRFSSTVYSSNENHFSRMTSLTSVTLHGTAITLIPDLIKNPSLISINIYEADVRRVLCYLSNTTSKYRLSFTGCFTTPELTKKLRRYGLVVMNNPATT